MKLVVGLGNPGAEYQRTRHNAGFMVLDRLAERCAAEDPAAPSIWRGRFSALTLETRLAERSSDGTAERVLLMKPTTFMNRSGQAVGDAIRFFKLDPAEDLLVVVDDIALPCGRIRLRAKGGDGGHNGLASVRQHVGGDAYVRLRVGIDPPGIVPQVDYVLGRFTDEQLERIDEAIGASVEAIRLWAHEGVVAAANRFNASDKPKRESKPRPAEDAADAEPTKPTRDQDAGATAGRGAGPGTLPGADDG